MPSPKATRDLDAGGDFLPQERTNDYEYNQLLYKFRTLYNEAKNFQELHRNCSVTRAAAPLNNCPKNSTEPPLFGSSSTPNNTNQHLTGLCSPPLAINSSSSSNNKYTISALTKSNGQQVSGQQKRSFFQHQNTVPPVGSKLNGAKDAAQFNRQPSSDHQSPPQTQKHQESLGGSGILHYNSSYNLSNSAPVHYQAGQSSIRPEIRQRNPMSSSRLLLSKSSERLDSINNNHIPLASSLKNHDLDSFRSNNFTAPVARDSKYLQNDDNIYDAVSPDDCVFDAVLPGGYTPGDDIATNYNVASYIRKLNRLSLAPKSKLESSKSLLGLGSTADPPSLPQPASCSKSTPNGKLDSEKSNNSFGSSNILDSTNHSSSSLSLHASKDDYSNYVNIDFFLKRSNSPSFDGLEEDASNDDDDGESSDVSEDTTQMSHSLSSDQICEEAMRNVSPRRELNQKLTNKGDRSSASITPASSGDFLDEQRSSSMLKMKHQLSATSKPNDMATKLASFFTTSSNREGDGSGASKSNTASPRESGNKSSPKQQQGLEPICERSTGPLFSLRNVTTNHHDSSQLSTDGSALVEAHNTMRSFLSDLNLSPVDDVFEDKAQRRIVKESFAVEFCGRRKLRHLFLFNDVIVCAKYQASSKQKFTFDVKWYLNLNGVSIADLSDVSNQVKYDKEVIENQILAIRTNLMLLRGQMQQIKRSKHKQPSKIIKKLKKKRTELEAELVLLLPHLPLVIKHVNGKKFTFFLSSNFDRNQWVESIKFLQSQLGSPKSTPASPSSSELQAWIQTCRKNLNPSLGTFLLRSNCDDDLLYGDLYINLSGINGITKPGNYYFCFEVDSYGHFSQKASSTVLRIDKSDHVLNEEYVFPLDGAHTLRILIYEDLGLNTKPSVIGKAHVELSRAWFLDKPVEKTIVFNSNCSLRTQLSYSSSELLSMRVPHAKLCPTFGMDITQVCKKEKTNVPLLIQLCVNEVERRGMREVGIYRMSGTSTDVQRLKKAFETNPHVAELLLRDIDINSVTGFLKTYLREMPEGLFSNKLYLKFVAAFNIPQSESLERTRSMLELFHKIPITNQHTIIYLVEHLVKVNKFENHNKMSLTNLATVLGPNILRAPATDSSSSGSSDPFTAVVIGSMSQAGILYFFLNRKFSNLPLTEMDPSELTPRSSGS